MPLVEVRDLTVEFRGEAGWIAAVAGVDFTLAQGDVLAVLGESGCGKSVTLRAMLRLLPAKRSRVGGRIWVDGRDVLGMSPTELAAYRGRDASMIFQEPGLALDPVYRLGDQIAETVMRHDRVSRREGRARALELFERVGIPSPLGRLDNYPHEMSGGMRQRAMIALALACRPKVLLADEPTTALDATVQIQILLLLRELRRDLGLSIIFVTHDVGVAVEIADRVAVMYAGRIVEMGSCAAVIRNPAHPYTRGLLASRAGSSPPTPGARLETIPGAPPDLTHPLPGCAFAPRCRIAEAACERGVPLPVARSPGHWARCIRLHDAAVQGGPCEPMPVVQ